MSQQNHYVYEFSAFSPRRNKESSTEVRRFNAESLKGLPKEKLYSYSWSRDGSQLAFVRGSEIRDILLRMR